MSYFIIYLLRLSFKLCLLISLTSVFLMRVFADLLKQAVFEEVNELDEIT
jgi:hypothetical protein